MAPSAQSLDEAWASVEPVPWRRQPPPAVAARAATVDPDSSPAMGSASASALPVQGPALPVQARTPPVPNPNDGSLVVLMEHVLKEIRLAREESERKHQSLLLAACLLLAGMIVLMDRSLRRTLVAPPPSA